jgi:hypothetical protein
VYWIAPGSLLLDSSVRPPLTWANFSASASRSLLLVSVFSPRGELSPRCAVPVPGEYGAVVVDLRRPLGEYGAEEEVVVASLPRDIAVALRSLAEALYELSSEVSAALSAVSAAT